MFQLSLVMALARQVLGNLAPHEAPRDARDGAPVQLLQFQEQGEAVAFLADALKERPAACIGLGHWVAGSCWLLARRLTRRRIPKCAAAASAAHPAPATVAFDGALS